MAKPRKGIPGVYPQVTWSRMDGLWVRVTGRVQGVGFRAHVRSAAENLELQGEVWNTRDGAVEFEVFGDSALLQELVLQIRFGPGRVDSVTSQPLSRPSVRDGFHVGFTR